jgi:TonB family protein
LQTSPDPQFLEDLAERTRLGEPVPPLPKKIIRRVVPNHLRNGLRVSLGLHGALLAYLMVAQVVSAVFGDEKAKRDRLKIEMARTSIRVDVVDLPQLKMTDMVGIDATAEVGAPPPPPPPKESPKKEVALKAKEAELKAAEAAAAKASETAMIDRTRKDAEAKKKKAKEEAAKKAAAKSEDRLKALRDSLRAETRRQELVADYKGPRKDGGRPLLAGNIQSEGNSTTGDVAKSADIYAGKVRAHLQRFWNVPEYMKAGTLRGTVIVRLSPDGRLLKKELGRKSGNAEYDEALLRMVEAADPFPPPPEELRRWIMEDGFECGP